MYFGTKESINLTHSLLDPLKREWVSFFAIFFII